MCYMICSSSKIVGVTFEFLVIITNARGSSTKHIKPILLWNLEVTSQTIYNQHDKLKSQDHFYVCGINVEVPHQVKDKIIPI